MLELYYLEEADSICSNRAVMTLNEKGINDWVPHKIVLMNGDQFTPEYQKLNPKSQVPTLIHNGKAIRESSIICRYIDGLKSTPALTPDDPVERAYMDEWIKDCDESGYQATASINFVTKFRLAVSIEKMEARWKQVTDIDRIHRQQSCIREGLDSLYVLRAVGAWERIFTKAEKSLSDGRPWIMGNDISLVETTHAPFIKVLDLLRLLDIWMDGRPHLQAWWERVKLRDSYKALEEYPGQSDDDDAPHAMAGRKVVSKFEELLDNYRKMMPKS
ncbi:MAG: glutathione S-transferase family protein [Rhodospirillales bacterium]|nr:glutathione S-transferase family protein [Rhodospirillales bacterium]